MFHFLTIQPYFIVIYIVDFVSAALLRSLLEPHVYFCFMLKASTTRDLFLGIPVDSSESFLSRILFLISLSPFNKPVGFNLTSSASLMRHPPP